MTEQHRERDNDNSVSLSTVDRKSGSHDDPGPIDPAKMMLLFNASKALASTIDLDHLLNVIVSEVQTVLDCDGSGVFLYDEERDDFYWRIVQDKERLLASARDEIRVPKDSGVCGWVFKTGEPALIHDAAHDPRIYREVDNKSGFTTRNMICVPLQTREKRFGVLYALNKSHGSFTDEDVEVMVALAGSVALALENAAYYDSLASSHKELERLNLVKSRILNHLSHELKTPLAIIEASLKILQRKLAETDTHLDKVPFDRLTRNLERLKTIERQVSYIVEDKEYPERQIILDFLDHLKDFIDIKADEEPALSQAMEALRAKIEEQFPSKVQETELVSIAATFQAAEFRVKQMTRDRVLDVEFHPPDPALIKMQPYIMMSVLGGIVRNAVENTPDHGKIVITGENSPAGYKITVRDYGVGIPESEQKNIFEAFCPVQETDLYTSGRRYQFGAGGTGTDLLKIKIFSERFGFKVSFRSFRCSCIPTIRDICPGDITKCVCCKEIEDCYRNGGTEFVVEISPERVETPAPDMPTAEVTAD